MERGNPALRIAAVYVGLGLLYILFSDTLLTAVTSSPEILSRIQTLKGSLFIGLTGGILYLLIHRAEKGLVESRRTLATLLSNLPAMAYRCRNDEHWTMEFVSEGCRDLTGWEQADLLNNANVAYAQVIHALDREAVWQGVQSALEHKIPFRLVYRIVRRDGQERWAWEQGRGVFSRDGKLLALEGIIFDITEKREAEQELERHRHHLEEMVLARARQLEAAQKALVQKEKLKTLGAIAAEVSHEIRNPLVAACGFARRLQKRHPELAEVGIMLQECHRLEKILDRIQSYLKPLDARPQECLINPLIEGSILHVLEELEAKRIDYRLDLQPELSPAYADPDMLTDVSISLIRNAVRFMDEQGALIIRTYEGDCNILVDFASLGSGAKIKDPELMFLPFDEEGESIGVPFSYRMLKDMGGLLSFTQKKDSMIFTMSLPRAT